MITISINHQLIYHKILGHFLKTWEGKIAKRLLTIEFAFKENRMEMGIPPKHIRKSL